MRGKGVSGFSLTSVIRITPAYAGKRSKLRLRGSFRGDHPRLCGEKLMLPWCFPFIPGSPPPMRGKVPTAGLVERSGGITPAYAGKRRLLRRMTQTTKDHPRLCGEKYDAGFCFPRLHGSPPPMRGKVVNITTSPVNSGITPAYAGKSRSPHQAIL